VFFISAPSSTPYCRQSESGNNLNRVMFATFAGGGRRQMKGWRWSGGKKIRPLSGGGVGRGRGGLKPRDWGGHVSWSGPGEEACFDSLQTEGAKALRTSGIMTGITWFIEKSRTENRNRKKWLILRGDKGTMTQAPDQRKVPVHNDILVRDGRYKVRR